jgi:hypothetical protein
MVEKINEILKKFEQDHEVYVDAQDTKAYWVVTARIPKSGQKGLHNLHQGVRYITASNGDGNVLVMHNPELSGNFFIETWEKSKTFEDFVTRSLKRILEEKNAADPGPVEGCGSGCG